MMRERERFPCKLMNAVTVRDVLYDQIIYLAWREKELEHSQT